MSKPLVPQFETLEPQITIPPVMHRETSGLVYGSLAAFGAAKVAILGSVQTDDEVFKDVTSMARCYGGMAIHALRSPDTIGTSKGVSSDEILDGFKSFATEHRRNGLLVMRSTNFDASISKGCEEVAEGILEILDDDKKVAPKVLAFGRYSGEKPNQSAHVLELHNRFMARFKIDNSFELDNSGVVEAVRGKNAQTYRNVPFGKTELSKPRRQQAL